MIHLVGILTMIAVFGALVGFHEYGHFVFAKRFGVAVPDFALGFGPTLLSFKNQGTTFRLNLLPLGGYCRMLGFGEAESDGTNGFGDKPLAARAVILFAGPVFNILLAAILFAVVACVYGIPHPTGTVRSVQDGSPAQRAGLLAGDTIAAVDGQSADVVGYIHAHPNTSVRVDVVRNGVLLHLRITTMDKQGVGALGFIPGQAGTVLSPAQALITGTTMAFTITAQTFEALGSAVAHHDSSGFTGPVGIGKLGMDAASAGVAQTLFFAGVLSIALGALNLLPLPALDGGRLLFLLLEFVRRGKRLDPVQEGYAHAGGFALLLLISLLVTVRDVASLTGHQ